MTERERGRETELPHGPELTSLETKRANPARVRTLETFSKFGPCVQSWISCLSEQRPFLRCRICSMYGGVVAISWLQCAWQSSSLYGRRIASRLQTWQCWSGGMLTTPLAELQLLWHRWSNYDMDVATRTHLSKIFRVGCPISVVFVSSMLAGVAQC